jgi:isoquinoline 1-oxidoreductase subunit beta
VGDRVKQRQGPGLRSRFGTAKPASRGIDRRSLLIAGGVGVGLMIGWSVWPREYPGTLSVAKGEHVFGSYVKIGENGQVTVVVPQVEMGQGAYTLIAQIIADELGADWRTVAIEPAPINPNYTNTLVAAEWNEGLATQMLAGVARWGFDKLAKAETLQITGNSSTIRAFEAIVRDAGATARALLCMAAARAWDADWRACDTVEGFVVRGNDKIRFGEIAAEAAGYDAPSTLLYREGRDGRLRGQSVPRLDLPSKVDGSANYAADVRLPGMVYAAIRMGPLGEKSFKGLDREALEAGTGILRFISQKDWVAVVARTWWAAEKALERARPEFAVSGAIPNSKSAHTALDKAFGTPSSQWYETGDTNTALTTTVPIRFDYRVDFAPHAALEPMAATAVIRDDILEIWMPTQVPGLARRAAAAAIGWDEDNVILHPVIVGGSFGRKYETEIAAQIAVIVQNVKLPVQLIWSREQDMAQDRFRPAVAARMLARIDGGQVSAWRARIAAPATMAEMQGRIRRGKSAVEAQADVANEFEGASVSGAIPPYAIPNISIRHHAVDLGVPTGKWRSGADSYTAFFNECFVDELAHKTGVEAYSFRMAMLSGNRRLAECLTRVTARGGWRGGEAGSAQGIACHSMQGSHIAVLAEAHVDDNQHVVVTQIYAVADLGRVTHGDIALQQLEGGLLFGIAAAVGNPVTIDGGIVRPRSLGGLGFQGLADMPKMNIEIIGSRAAFGGVGEIGVPAVGPAIANALFAGSGRRYRSLPLMSGPVVPGKV